LNRVDRLTFRLQARAAYAVSSIAGRRRSRLFDGVERFCLFVGYPRSGHSLVGSLLDAHPDVVIANELDALHYVADGCRRDQLYWLILWRDSKFTQNGRRWTTFDYTVPGQWQGRFEHLRVVGDKKGGNSAVRLRQQPELLDRLAALVGRDVTLVHVIRNPFDNIATMSIRQGSTLEVASDRYFDRCETIQHLTSQRSASMLDVRYESLVADPRRVLADVCAQLGLQASDEYLDACAHVVFPTPHLSRNEVSWSEQMRNTIERRIGDFDFLAGYALDAR
jgi:hypothetical protein